MIDISILVSDAVRTLRTLADVSGCSLSVRYTCGLVATWGAVTWRDLDFTVGAAVVGRATTLLVPTHATVDAIEAISFGAMIIEPWLVF